MNSLAGRRRSGRVVGGWLYLLPVTCVVALVLIGPTLGAVYFAFTEWSGVGPAVWVGTDNFRKMFADPIYVKALGNTFLWTLITVSGATSLALIAAASVAYVRRGRTIYRLLLFMPVVLSSVVTVQIWRALYDPQMGLVGLLAGWGLVPPTLSVLGIPGSALPAVAAVSVWHGMGIPLVLYLAAIQGIDTELYEVARIDGASRMQEFRYVTIPGIRPVVVFTMLLGVIDSLLVFDWIWLMTRGGPGYATEVINVLAYQSFQEFDAGYAAALGLGSAILVGIAGAFFVILRRRGAEV